MPIVAEDILVSDSLRSRPARPRDYAREVEGMNALAQCMLKDPARLQQCFSDVALALCGAGSAGISMLEGADGAAPIFRWTALAGAFASYVGGSTPRDFSPCGLCLDRDASILVYRPGRVFTYFNEAAPEIVEGLVVPLHDADGTAVGTIWIVSHDEGRKFDATDVVVMEQIAGFFAVATRMAGVLADSATTAKREKAKRRKAEEALRQSIKMDALGQMTGGVAHDFNNLLAVISGSLEMAKEHLGADHQRARNSIERATRATARAADLTARLLAFARRQPLNPTSFDMNERVKGMVELVRPSLGTEIVVATDLDARLWPARADAPQLEMAVVNVVMNARDAMPNGGLLRLTTRNMAFSGAIVGAETLSGDFIALTISDTGSGMPPEIAAKAFEPFFTTKGIGKGTGLGLSMVYNFVRESGGSAAIASEPGKGTAVTLYIPKGDARAAAPLGVERPAKASVPMRPSGAGAPAVEMTSAAAGE
jgi:signal transduction histidine kinase